MTVQRAASTRLGIPPPQEKVHGGQGSLPPSLLCLDELPLSTCFSPAACTTLGTGTLGFLLCT